MVALNASPIGKTLQVKWIIGSPDETADIRGIGIEEGSPITLLRNIGGNVIIAMNDLRYAMSEDLAYRIKVG